MLAENLAGETVVPMAALQVVRLAVALVDVMAVRTVSTMAD